MSKNIEINPLKVYKMDFEKKVKNSNKNIIKKSRPCVAIQISVDNMYYGSTAYMMVPLSSNYHPDLENYKVELVIIDNKKSYGLVYNFVIVSKEDFKIWINKETGKEIYITEEELKEIIDTMLKMVLIGGRMTLEQFNKKPYFDEMVEKIERSNQQLKKGNEQLKEDNKEMKREIFRQKEDNKELKEDNKELKLMLKEILKNFENLKK